MIWSAARHAREQLAYEVKAPGGTIYSPQFFETYSKELKRAAFSLLSNPDPRIRLNAAVVVARVAEQINNPDMLDLTEKLLADQSPAVAMWGLMAAQNILPSLLQVGLPAQQLRLIADITSHASNPQLLASVYNALSLNYARVRIANLPPNWNKAVTLVVPQILSLLTARRDQYRNQVVKEPTADVDGMNCLVYQAIWDQMNPAQQLQTIQLLSDIAGLAGQHADGSIGTEHEQLVTVITKAASRDRRRRHSFELSLPSGRRSIHHDPSAERTKRRRSRRNVAEGSSSGAGLVESDGCADPFTGRDHEPINRDGQMTFR